MCEEPSRAGFAQPLSRYRAYLGAAASHAKPHRQRAYGAWLFELNARPVFPAIPHRHHPPRLTQTLVQAQAPNVFGTGRCSCAIQFEPQSDFDQLHRRIDAIDTSKLNRLHCTQRGQRPAKASETPVGNGQSQ